jgi:hypothetical protein
MRTTAEIKRDQTAFFIAYLPGVLYVNYLISVSSMLRNGDFGRNHFPVLLTKSCMTAVMLEIISLSMKSSIMMQERPEGGRSMTELLRSHAHDSQGTDPAVKEGRDCRPGSLCESFVRLGCVILTRHRLLAFVGPHLRHCPFNRSCNRESPLTSLYWRREKTARACAASFATLVVGSPSSSVKIER